MHRSSDRLQFIHFADDTTVYMTGSDLKTLCRDFNLELIKLDDWLMANRLSLNLDKTHFMLLTHNNYNMNDCAITIRDHPLSIVTSTKFLGIHIDNRLSYNVHLASLCKQLSRVRGILYRVSHFLPPHIIKNLYYALFYSRLVYGCAVWGGGGITMINRLNSLNKSAINIFSSNLPPDKPRPQSFSNVHKLVILCTFFKYLNSSASLNSYFHSIINSLVPVHVHGTRFSLHNNISIPNVKKTVSQHQFLFIASKLWNSLPVNLKNIPSALQFKKNLKFLLYDTDIL